MLSRSAVLYVFFCAACGPVEAEPPEAELVVDHFSFFRNDFEVRGHNEGGEGECFYRITAFPEDAPEVRQQTVARKLDEGNDEPESVKGDGHFEWPENGPTGAPRVRASAHCLDSLGDPVETDAGFECDTTNDVCGPI